MAGVDRNVGRGILPARHGQATFDGVHRFIELATFGSRGYRKHRVSLTARYERYREVVSNEVPPGICQPGQHHWACYLRAWGPCGPSVGRRQGAHIELTGGIVAVGVREVVVEYRHVSAASCSRLV